MAQSAVGMKAGEVDRGEKGGDGGGRGWEGGGKEGCGGGGGSE